MSLLWTFILLLRGSRAELVPEETTVVKTIAAGETQSYSINTGAHTTDCVLYLTDLGTGSLGMGNTGFFGSDNDTSTWVTWKYDEEFTQDSEITFEIESTIGTKFAMAASFTSHYTMQDSIPMRITTSGGSAIGLKIEVEANPSDVQFSLVPIGGDPNLYCGTTDYPDAEDSGTYKWTLSGSEGNLDLTTSSEGFPSPPLFYCTLAGTPSEPIEAAITVTSSHEDKQLIPGVPVQDTIEAGKYKYYKVDVSGDGKCDLFTVATVLSGDPDLYMSKTHPRPTSENHEEGDASSAHWGSDYITNHNVTSGTYYISVLAAAGFSCEYTLTSMYSCPGDGTGATTTLINGMGQVDLLESGSNRMYSFSTPEAVQDISITLTPLYGDADLYVRKFDSSRAEDDGDYIWESKSWGADFIKISSTDPNACQNCELQIMVYAFTESIYTLTAVSANHRTTLRNGVSTTDSTEPGAFAYFDMHVPTSETLEVIVSPWISGNIRLYASRTDHYPNATHNDWSVEGDRPTLRIDANAGDDIFISLGSDDAMTFDIVASAGGMVELADGVLQSGFVNESEFRHFELAVNNIGHKDLSITLTILSGTAEIYVSTSEMPVPADTATWQWRDWPWDESTAVKQIEIGWEDPSHCLHSTENERICHYWITVLGKQDNTEFSLRATTNDAIMPLTGGIPARGVVTQGNYLFYQISTTEAGQQLDVQITNFRGDANMYISKDSSFPNETQSDWSAVGTGDDQWHLDHCDYPATYYIGVTCCEGGLLGCSNSSFSISAMLDYESRPGTTLLSPGVPTDGVITSFNQEKWKYYEIRIPDTHVKYNQMEISVIYSLFAPDVFVTRNANDLPSRDNYEWRHLENTDALITIDDPEPGRYFIGVSCKWASHFTVTVSLDDTMIELQDGQGFSSTLGKDMWQYFTFPVTAKRDIEFWITQMNGDPDLYVSVGEKPTTDTATWAAMNFGSDAIEISEDDPDACGDCTYIIGVFAFTESSFTLNAEYEAVTQLNLGSPTHGTMVGNMKKFYSFFVPDDTATTIAISVTITSGDLELYVCKGDKKPTQDDYDFMSNEWGAASGEHIDIQHESCGATEGNGCEYTILVFCDWDVEYDLTVDSASTTQVLQNTVPVTTSLKAGEESHYTYHQIESTDSMDFSLTPVSGEPSIYVKNGASPTSNDYDQMVTGAGSVHIDNPEAAFYYATVYAGSTDTTFSITALSQRDENRTEHEAGSALIDGVNAYGSVAESNFKYYTFTAGPSETGQARDATLTMTILSGTPEVYVKQTTQPSTGDFDLKMDHNTLHMEGAVPAHNRTAWNIGVYGQGGPAEYYIAVTIDDTSILLQQGVPQTATMQAGEKAYYRFDADAANKDVSIRVTYLLGEPKFFVSNTEQHPTKESCNYEGVNDQLGGSVLIPTASLDAHLSTWFIGVEAGPSDAYITLLVSYQGTTTLTQDHPSLAELDEGEEGMFEWRVGESKDADKSLTIGVSSVVGVVDFYVGVDSKPNALSNAYKSIGGTPSSVVIDESDDYFKRPARYYILVQCPPDQGVCEFYISVSSGNEATTSLQFGASVDGSVDKSAMKTYAIMVGDDTMDELSFHCTTTLGAVALYASTTEEHPSQSKSEWRKNIAGEGVLTISKDDPGFTSSGVYFLTVEGVEAQNEYTIFADRMGGVMTPIILMLEKKQSMVIPHDALGWQKKLYSFRVGSIPHVSFAFLVVAGKIEVFYHNDGQEPSEAHTLPARTGPNHTPDNFAYHVGEDELCDTCEYLILVRATPGSIYSVEATMRIIHPGPYPRRIMIVMAVAITLLVASLIMLICYCVQKQRRLRAELEATEIELNQHGVAGPRQRRKDREYADSRERVPIRGAGRQYMPLTLNEDNLQNL